MTRRTVLVLLLLATTIHAFSVTPRTTTTSSSTTVLGLFKKKEEEDLSFIESRDMTREEMKALNEENERVMNAELTGMTIFSLIISVPMLYLVWVAFFSETAELAGDIVTVKKEQLALRWLPTRWLALGWVGGAEATSQEGWFSGDRETRDEMKQ